MYKRQTILTTDDISVVNFAVVAGGSKKVVFTMALKVEVLFKVVVNVGVGVVVVVVVDVKELVLTSKSSSSHVNNSGSIE